MNGRIIDGDFTETHELKVYWNPDYNEYTSIVKVKATGSVVAEYFTNDKEDAKSTGRRELQNSTDNKIFTPIVDFRN